MYLSVGRMPPGPRAAAGSADGRTGNDGAHDDAPWGGSRTTLDVTTRVGVDRCEGVRVGRSVCVCVCRSLSVCVDLSLCVYIYVCVCVCMCVCVCV